MTFEDFKYYSIILLDLRSRYSLLQCNWRQKISSLCWSWPCSPRIQYTSGCIRWTSNPKRSIGVVITPTKGLANNIVHFLPFSHVVRSPHSRYSNCQNWMSLLSKNIYYNLQILLTKWNNIQIATITTLVPPTFRLMYYPKHGIVWHTGRAMCHCLFLCVTLHQRKPTLEISGNLPLFPNNFLWFAQKTWIPVFPPISSIREVSAILKKILEAFKV